jgi:hypothetical protein
MTDFNQYEYLQQLAAKHKLILHTPETPRVHTISSVFNLEEFEARMNNCDGLQVLSVNLDDYSAVGENADTISDNIFNTFWVVKKAISGDVADKKATREVCKSIANNFVGRMRKHRLMMQQRELERTSLMNFDPLTVNIRAYELPIGDQYIGVQVNYRIITPSAMVDTPEVWMD